MSDRAETLAHNFEAAHAEFINAVDAFSDSEWNATCVGETWPVGVTAHHVAGSIAPITGLVQSCAAGQWPGMSFAVINEGNATHAKEFANCTRSETLDLARSSGTAASTAMRGLSDAQLDSRGLAVTELGEVSVRQLVENILTGHIVGHLASMRAAV